MSGSLFKLVVSGFFWKFSERILAQAISFIVSVVIARILSPDDYGLVAMCMIFIAIAEVFVTRGFSAALIQNKNSDELDFSTVFYISLALSIFLYLIVFFSAPAISLFYDNEILEDLVRIYAIILPISAYKSIQNAFVSKKMDFKKFFFSTLAGTVVSGVVGIYLAVKGFGVWALVGQYFSNNIIDSLVLSFTIKWKPKLLFSVNRAKPLMSYGIKVLCADLIGTLYHQLNAFLIGKKYTPSDLAYYTRGKQFPDLISNNIGITLSNVLFPAFSTKSDDCLQLKNMSKKAISLSSFALMPIYFGLIAVSVNFITMLLTEKWLPCIPFLIIMCVNGIIGTIDIVDIQILNALGKSDVVLKMEFIKKPLYLLITLLALHFNLIALALVVPLSSIIAILVNSYYVNKYINYSLFDKIKDVSKSFICSLFMGIIIYFMNYLNVNPIILLIIQGVIGLFLYVGFSFLVKNENLYYCLDLLRVKK